MNDEQKIERCFMPGCGADMVEMELPRRPGFIESGPFGKQHGWKVICSMLPQCGCEGPLRPTKSDAVMACNEIARRVRECDASEALFEDASRYLATAQAERDAAVRERDAFAACWRDFFADELDITFTEGFPYGTGSSDSWCVLCHRETADESCKHPTCPSFKAQGLLALLDSATPPNKHACNSDALSARVADFERIAGEIVESGWPTEPGEHADCVCSYCGAVSSEQVPCTTDTCPGVQLRNLIEAKGK